MLEGAFLQLNKANHFPSEVPSLPDSFILSIPEIGLTTVFFALS
jgi:hypothetical protein